MKPRPVSRAAALCLCMALAVCGGRGQTTPRGRPLRVTCTTSLAAAVVRAVGGDRVAVHTMVPFGMCPGHFDLTPGEAARLRNADMFLCHGFERFLDGVELLPGTRMIKAGVQGNWMIPAIHTQAVARVRDVLVDAMPGSGAYVTQQADDYCRAVVDASRRLTERLAPIRGTPVVCAVMNRDLVEWCGLQVVADFARDEDISVKALHEILTRGSASHAALVVDNRQSSGKIGRTIADELGVPFVMLSNFPEGDATDGGYPYLETLKATIDAIVERLEGRGSRVEGKK